MLKDKVHERFSFFFVDNSGCWKTDVNLVIKFTPFWTMKLSRRIKACTITWESSNHEKKTHAHIGDKNIKRNRVYGLFLTFPSLNKSLFDTIALLFWRSLTFHSTTIYCFWCWHIIWINSIIRQCLLRFFHCCLLGLSTGYITIFIIFICIVVIIIIISIATTTSITTRSTISITLWWILVVILLLTFWKEEKLILR